MAASVVDSLDDEMDDLHVSLTVEVVAGTMPLPVAVELAMVARFYERFGDHAVNLAKRVAALTTTRRPIDLSNRPPERRRRPDPAGLRRRGPALTSASAIWTALRAAPLRRLSPLTNRASRSVDALGPADAPDQGRVPPGREQRGRARRPASTPGAPASMAMARSGVRSSREVGHDGQGVPGEDRYPHAGAGDRQVGDAEDLPALVAELLLLAGLARAVVDQVAGQGQHVVGDGVGED